MRHRHPSSSTKATHNGGGQLRIIAGEWRSRKLPVADVTGLRPTSDRVRETVFSWLTNYIPSAKILDVFCGTGALSLEALSRGASSAMMLEKNPLAVKALRSNIAVLKAERAQLIETDSLSWLTRPAPHAFDVIFLDPPFHMDLLATTCELLETNGYLDNNSIIYIEAEKELAILPVPSHWQLMKRKTAGQVQFSLWSPD